jgi:hypothetical protein
MDLPPTFTVNDAIVACGVNNVDLYEGQTQANRISNELFIDDFHTCMDLTNKDIDDVFKTFSGLTVAQGQIRLLPGPKQRIKAFAQWTREQFRLGRDPTMAPFPVDDTAMLMRRYKTHQLYIDTSSTLSAAAKPDKLTAQTKWEDWAPSFSNYLRAIPGRDGIPLLYITRKNDLPDPTPNPNFLDDYVMNANLTGQSFSIDAATVHTLIVHLTSGNQQAESVIKVHENERNGRLDYKALLAHYEGTGIYANDISKAEQDLKTLFYGGEKPPHMWWVEFERRLTGAFQVYVKREGRIVHSDEMKLRTLIEKVKCDWLAPVKAGISIELTKIPVTYTYAQALTAFRTEVNKKHPPSLSSETRTRRHIQETNQRSGGRGRGSLRGRGGRHYGGGYGRGGRGGRFGRGGRGNRQKEYITLKDGRKVEYHASFNFPADVFHQMQDADRDRLKREREEYNNRNNRGRDNSTRTVSELQREIEDLRSTMANTQNENDGASVPGSVAIQRGTSTSGTTSGTMMGGRNDQQRKKYRTE